MGSSCTRSATSQVHPEDEFDQCESQRRSLFSRRHTHPPNARPIAQPVASLEAVHLELPSSTLTTPSSSNGGVPPTPPLNPFHFASVIHLDESPANAHTIPTWQLPRWNRDLPLEPAAAPLSDVSSGGGQLGFWSLGGGLTSTATSRRISSRSVRFEAEEGVYADEAVALPRPDDLFSISPTDPSENNGLAEGGAVHEGTDSSDGGDEDDDSDNNEEHVNHKNNSGGSLARHRSKNPSGLQLSCQDLLRRRRSGSVESNSSANSNTSLAAISPAFRRAILSEHLPHKLQLAPRLRRRN